MNLTYEVVSVHESGDGTFVVHLAFPGGFAKIHADAEQVDVLKAGSVLKVEEAQSGPVLDWDDTTVTK